MTKWKVQWFEYCLIMLFSMAHCQSFLAILLILSLCTIKQFFLVNKNNLHLFALNSCLYRVKNVLWPKTVAYGQVFRMFKPNPHSHSYCKAGYHLFQQICTCRTLLVGLLTWKEYDRTACRIREWKSGHDAIPALPCVLEIKKAK